jgi:hypothetical protein
MPDEHTFDRADESLLFSFSELLRRLNITVDMATLRQDLAGQDLNFDTLAEGENVHIIARGEYGSWPTSNNAIIRFQFQDQEQPYIEVEGNREANIIDHYCIVADFEHRTIIDSANGAIREGLQYGQPVSWAMFEPGSAAKTPAPQIDQARSYVVLRGGESGWEIARKLKISGQDLADHNDLDNATMSLIPAATILHLPIAKPEPVEKRRITTFEFMRRPLEMHVSKSGGTRKYTFGNAKKPEDIKETGPHAAENKNVLIYAIAHVPIGDEIYGYYMESSDLDVNTKKVKWTVGYNHSHLAEGYVDEKTTQPSPQVQEAIQVMLEEAAASKAAMEAEPEPVVEEIAEPEQTEPDWHDSFQPLNTDGIPEVYLFNQNIVVTDLEDKSPNKLLRKLAGVRIAGTFTGPDGNEYWRPQDAMTLGTWYGIPVLDPETGAQVLTSEADIFNTNLPLSERVTLRHGRLTTIERYFTVPLARATAKSKWLSARAKKINKQ